MPNKPPLILYSDWSKLIVGLPDADAGYIFKRLFAHNEGIELESMDHNPILDSLVAFMTEKIDINIEKYKAKQENMRVTREKRWKQNTDSNLSEICQNTDSNLSDSTSKTITKTKTKTNPKTMTKTISTSWNTRASDDDSLLELMRGVDE